ncbi:YggU family protein [bacterium]|nr:YggU family protein [bacterium]
MALSPEGVFLSETPDGVVLNIRVIPNSSKNMICGPQGDCIRIKIASAPVRGKANEECVKLLANLFDIKKSRVILLRGETARNKQVLLEGISKEDVIGRLKG